MVNRCSDEEVIPESILSVSKDARYIQQCQKLLIRSLAFLFERREALAVSVPTNQERNRELKQARKHIIWMISCILYILASTITGRTLGMEALGLKFSSDNNAPTKTGVNEMTDTRIRRFLFVCMSLLSAATGGLVSEYFSTQNSIENVKNDFLDEGDCGNQQQCQERSRGRERRLVHERLRRKMIERAANLDGLSPAPGANISNQLAQQQTELGRDNSTISRRATSFSLSDCFSKVFRELFKLIFKVYSNSDGPHNIIQHTSNENENNGGYSRSTSYSIVLWIGRLHLAHFLLTGKYPTLIHRFLGLEPRREKSMHSTTSNTKPRIAVLDRPTTNRAIAALILLQASTSLIRNTSNWFAEKVASYLEARASEHRRTRDRKNNVQLDNAQLRKKLDKIFQSHSSEYQEKHKVTKGTLGSSIGRRSKRGDKKTTILCTICRLERKHPAAPSSCGHVCCWNCLIQWVSTVRPECPICRAPCNAKDVLPLHNYEPAL